MKVIYSQQDDRGRAGAAVLATPGATTKAAALCSRARVVDTAIAAAQAAARGALLQIDINKNGYIVFVTGTQRAWGDARADVTNRMVPSGDGWRQGKHQHCGQVTGRVDVFSLSSSTASRYSQ